MTPINKLHATWLCWDHEGMPIDHWQICCWWDLAVQEKWRLTFSLMISFSPTKNFALTPTAPDFRNSLIRKFFLSWSLLFTGTIVLPSGKLDKQHKTDRSLQAYFIRWMKSLGLNPYIFFIKKQALAAYIKSINLGENTRQISCRILHCQTVYQGSQWTPSSEGDSTLLCLDGHGDEVGQLISNIEKEWDITSKRMAADYYNRAKGHSATEKTHY